MTDTSQKKRLLELFEDVPFLSVRTIIRSLDVNSPRKIISNLRDDGVPILDRWESYRGPHGEYKRFKLYYLDKSNEGR